MRGSIRNADHTLRLSSSQFAAADPARQPRGVWSAILACIAGNAPALLIAPDRLPFDWIEATSARLIGANLRCSRCWC